MPARNLLWITFATLALLRGRNYNSAMSTKDKLISDIEAFLKRHELGPTQFGLMSLRDGALMIKLRRGSDITTSRADRVYKFMADFEKKSRKQAGGRAA